MSDILSLVIDPDDRKVLTLLRSSKTPMWANEFCEVLGLQPYAQLESARFRLERLVRLGLAERSRARISTTKRVYYTPTDTGGVT